MNSGEREANTRELKRSLEQMESWTDEDLQSYRQYCESVLKEEPSHPCTLLLKSVLRIIARRKAANPLAVGPAVGPDA